MKQATIAAIRFGCGLGRTAQPADAGQMLAALQGPDIVASRFPTLSLQAGLALRSTHAKARRAERDKQPGADAAFKKVRAQIAAQQRSLLATVVARQMDSQAPLRERLNLFWLDHFTAAVKSPPDAVFAPSYLDEVLRATMTQRFADMLRAVVTHPMMLIYLDQVASVGPNSPAGQRQERGLNENLARELLELHTLGVAGRYGQEDVRQLAELLTGLSFRPERGGFAFLPNLAEPGAETVLGRSYGGTRRGGLEAVLKALDDLSVHPDTARHMARKLAVHFLSDTPDPALIAHVEKRWLQTGGDLMQVYSALLEHPAAWAPLGAKVKQPIEFICTSCKALGLTGADIMTLPTQPWQEMIARALNTMGQPFLRPPGPDGWNEAGEAWITPLGLSHRIRWAMRSPERLVKPLPDPREFVARALDDAASAELLWAVGAADTVQQGVGLTLASPEFNRR